MRIVYVHMVISFGAESDGVFGIMVIGRTIAIDNLEKGQAYANARQVKDPWP